MSASTGPTVDASSVTAARDAVSTRQMLATDAVSGPTRSRIAASPAMSTRTRLAPWRAHSRAVALPMLYPDGWQVVADLEQLTPHEAKLSDKGRTLGKLAELGLNWERGASRNQALLDERLVACANLLPGMLSLYEWKGERAEDDEVGALFKTDAALLDRAIARIGELHPYEQPAILGWKCDAASPQTAEWLAGLLE